MSQYQFSPKATLAIILLVLFSLDAQAHFSAVVEVSGLNGNNGFTLNGEAAGDESGRSVSNIGDINADGNNDLIIGAPFADTALADAGISYVLFGGANLNSGFTAVFLSGLNGTTGFALDGVAAGDNAGFSVGYAGDLNDDGDDDLVIGAPNASPQGAGSGNSYILFGGTNVNLGFSTLFLSGLNGTTGFALNGVAAGDNAGASVTTVGDVNGDNRDDLIVGAPRASTNGLGSGNSYVLYGGSNVNLGFSSLFLSGLNSTTGLALNGVSAGDSSGFSVNAIGDVNNDNVNDFIIGAPNASPQGAGSGNSYVVFGGSNLGAGFGSIVLSGLDGSTGFALNGVAAGDISGLSVSATGDINADGIDDLIIGAPSSGNNGADSGSCYVLFGGANLNNSFSTVFLSSLNGVNGFVLNGVAAGDRLCAAVSFAGDLNNDGFDDLIMGAPHASPNGLQSGAAFVLFGRLNVNSGFSTLFLTALNGDTGFRINGENAGDHLGASLSSLGDVNGDGVDDLIVGAPNADPNGESSGNTYVVFGRPMGVFVDGFE